MRVMKKNRAFCLSLFSLVAVLGAPAHAQRVDDYDQSDELGTQPPVRFEPAPTGPGSRDERVLLQRLNGIVIVGSPEQIQAGKTAVGVETVGVDVPAGAIRAAESYIGDPASFASLDDMSRAMVIAYRRANMPVVNIVIPPQEITNGTVQVVAVVGNLADVNVKSRDGRPVADPGYYLEGWNMNKGSPVYESELIDQLRWKSRRFHRRVDAVYQAGKSYGETDIDLVVTENKPRMGYYGIDNTGSGALGEYRYFAGFSLGNLWGADHQLSYQFTTSEEGPDALNAHSLSYIMPVTFIPRTDFQVSGAVIDTRAVIGPSSTDGKGSQITGNFISQIKSWRGLSGDGRWGFQYKSSDNTFEFDQRPVSNNLTKVGQFFAEWELEKPSPFGHTEVRFGAWYSPGGMFGDASKTEAYDMTREGAKARYGVFRGGLTHRKTFGNGFGLSLSYDWQLATERLLPSEMFYIGGMNTVRGFDETSLRGDKGDVFRGEVHSPDLFKSFPQYGQFSVFGFLDAGRVNVRGEPSEFEGKASIASVGLGSTFNYNENFSFEMAYGFRVKDNALVRGNVEDEPWDDGRFHFRMLMRF